MPHVKGFPLSKFAKNAQLDQTQIELVLLLPSIEHSVLDLFALAKVANSIMTDGEELIFTAIDIIDNSSNLIKILSSNTFAKKFVLINYYLTL
jgi:hypothetical protein